MTGKEISKLQKGEGESLRGIGTAAYAEASARYQFHLRECLRLAGNLKSPKLLPPENNGLHKG